MVSTSSLRCLIQPTSIAVIGASERAGSPAGLVVGNLAASANAATAFPINPKYETVHGLKCYASLAQVPQPVDCVFIGVRAELGPKFLREAGEAGVKGAVLNANDFGSGGEDGHRRMEQLTSIAAEFDIALCGPNNIGLYNVVDDIGCWALPQTEFTPGNTALIVQSGTAAMLLRGDPYPLGLAYVITCGDEAVTTAGDYMDFVLDDPRVELVVLHLEAVRDPATFKRAALKAHRLGKKVVALKAGRSQLGARAIAAHTGGIAGEDQLYSAFLRQCGVVRARDIDELFQTAMLASVYTQRPTGRKFIAITNSGGTASLWADAASDAKLEMAELSPGAIESVSLSDPALTNLQNPVDTWGDGWRADAFPAIASTLMAEPDVGAVGMVLAMPDSGRAETLTARAVGDLLSGVPMDTGARFVLINSNAQGSGDAKAVKSVTAAGVPYLVGVSESAKALSHWLDWPTPSTVEDELESLPATTELRRSWLAQNELAASLGVPLVPSRRVMSVDDALGAADSLATSVVVKGQHVDVPHKTEAGLVRLNLSTREQVAEAFEDIESAIKRANISWDETEVVVQPMSSAGFEMIVGARNYPGFGTMVVIGVGGTFVEVFNKATARMAPVARHQVDEMIAELGLDPIFDGVRGKRALDRRAFTDCVVAVGDLGRSLINDAQAVEINPVLVMDDGEGALGLDLLIEFAE